jgi:hypothetical protein
MMFALTNAVSVWATVSWSLAESEGPLAIWG